MKKNNTYGDGQLTRRIMRRVYLVWMLRLAVNPFFLKSIIALVLIARTTKYISYEHVIANAPPFTDIPQVLVFLQGAMMHTGATSLALLFASLVLLLWLGMDFIGKIPQHYR